MSKHLIVSFVSGLIFSMGLTISGMVQPVKIISFLNFLGDWDPSLAFVMLGAIGTHFFAYRMIKSKKRPLLGGEFDIPQKTKLEPRLILGASLFGAGWGAAGFCPGPALTSMAALNSSSFIFVIAMLAGMFLFFIFQKLTLL